MKFLDSLQPLALALLRAAIGIIFLTHVAEFFGGGLLILGLFTRGAALVLTIEMCVAIWRVHSAHGILAVHDYEFPLMMAVGCFVLAAVGAGLFSVDNLLFGNGGGRPRKK